MTKSEKNYKRKVTEENYKKAGKCKSRKRIGIESDNYLYKNDLLTTCHKMQLQIKHHISIMLVRWSHGGNSLINN